jgi:hypothetical protein
MPGNCEFRNPGTDGIMDFSEAERALGNLNARKLWHDITDQQYTAELNLLRVQDTSGRWWQPDPASGRWLVWDGNAWQPGIPPSPIAADDNKLMDMQTFREISRTQPWHRRPQKWWDLFSILGGCVSAVIWFLYSGVRSNIEGLDLISPILMIGIPVFMVTYRVQLDDFLIPLQSHRKKFPKLVLVGAGIAVPFLTAFLLYNVFRISQYSLMHWNMVVGTFIAYAITREPILAKGYQAMKGISLKVPLFFIILLSVIVRIVTADDCLRDPLNARDCLRTGGYAETIAGTASAAASTAINGPEIVRTLTQQQPPASPPGGGGQPGGDGTTPALTPEEAAEEAQRQADEARRMADFEQASNAGWRNLVDRGHSGMTQNANGDWMSPSVAQDAARENAGSALQQDMGRRLEDMRDQILFGPHVFDPTRSDVMTGAIDRMLEQIKGGQEVSLEQYNRLRTAYGHDIMGNTLTPSQMPPAGENLTEIITDTVESSTREIITGQDADGNTSYSSAALRGILGGITGGQSEWVYTPASSVYDMQKYVNEGGDSALEAFRRSAERAVIDEVTGRVVEGGINVAGNIGGRVLDNLADRYPGKAEWVTRNLGDAHEYLTRERHLWGGTDDAARAASGSGDDIVRAASRHGDDAGRAAAGQADDTARAVSGQADDTARAASGQVDDTARAASGQVDDTARAASGQVDDTARAVSGQADDTARAASGQVDDTARRASEAGEGGLKRVEDIPRSGERTKLKDEIRERIERLQQQRTQGGKDLPQSFETVKSNVSPDDIVKRGGITPREQQIIKDLGRENDAIIKVRPRSEHAGQLIEAGDAVPKGPDIHIKTLKGDTPLNLSDDVANKLKQRGIEPRTTKYNPEVEHLGYDPKNQDLVVFRKPDPLPPSKPPDMSTREWRELREAHAQRMSEYINEGPKVEQLVKAEKITIDSDGLVRDFETEKPLTSDIDGWSLESRSNPGKPVSSEVRQRILSDPRGQTIFKHDTHANFPVADASRDIPAGSQPGTISPFDLDRRIDHRVIDNAANPNKGLISFDGASDTVDFVRYNGPKRFPHGLPD